MQIKNISGIDYEKNSDDENFSKRIRHTYNEPTNFRQKILVDLYGNLIDKASNVLEIGCGWGRNAQYFINEKHINYYSFDPSPTSLMYFKRLNLSSDRFYISHDLDNKITSNKYDLIFSTFVLQHVGFLPGNTLVDDNTLDSESLTQTLLQNLKVGGFWVSYESRCGQMGWNPDVWLKRIFENNDNYKILNRDESPLDGSDEKREALHRLLVIQKIA